MVWWVGGQVAWEVGSGSLEAHQVGAVRGKGLGDSLLAVRDKEGRLKKRGMVPKAGLAGDHHS